MAIAVRPKNEREDATSFSRLSTTCECGKPSAVYYYEPFRAFCSEHAPSQHGPDRA